MLVHSPTLDPVQGVLAVLDEGAATGADKFGLLLALIDLAPSVADDALTVDAIAEKLLEIHWDHALPFRDGVALRQVASPNRRNTTVIQTIEDLTGALGAPMPFEQAKRAVPDAAWRQAVRRVARDTARNPLQLLQRLPGDPAPFLYEYVPADRAIRFLPGAVDDLVVYGPVLRDLVQFRFVRFVARTNRSVLGASIEDDLDVHLFGAERHRSRSVSATRSSDRADSDRAIGVFSSVVLAGTHQGSRRWLTGWWTYESPPRHGALSPPLRCSHSAVDALHRCNSPSAPVVSSHVRSAR